MSEVFSLSDASCRTDAKPFCLTITHNVIRSWWFFELVAATVTQRLSKHKPIYMKEIREWLFESLRKFCFFVHWQWDQQTIFIVLWVRSDFKGALHGFYTWTLLVTTTQPVLSPIMLCVALDELCQVCQNNPDDVKIISSSLTFNRKPLSGNPVGFKKQGHLRSRV